ncbi:hypothetical protein NGM10_12635 [Halorussus salilacus]|uniref:hypothetical protein n=1 Tax=Halorussus salilacus TaxID=2953750 RepID=UPI00209D709F|nr:hypothetical protein [Halorussus salilacus]USZ67570.1 hypothetical protein NGM10_12635 [Halorussus salilacus]
MWGSSVSEGEGTSGVEERRKRRRKAREQEDRDGLGAARWAAPSPFSGGRRETDASVSRETVEAVAPVLLANATAGRPPPHGIIGRLSAVT